jgi:hypothetical protein
MLATTEYRIAHRLMQSLRLVTGRRQHLFRGGVEALAGVAHPLRESVGRFDLRQRGRVHRAPFGVAISRWTANNKLMRRRP